MEWSGRCLPESRPRSVATIVYGRARLLSRRRSDRVYVELSAASWLLLRQWLSSLSLLGIFHQMLQLKTFNRSRRSFPAWLIVVALVFAGSCSKQTQRN